MEKKLILIADDDPDVRESLKLMLGRASHRLLFAGNGQEVIQKMRKEIPDLLVLDLLMPGMDGFEVIKQLKRDSRLSKVPVLVLTAVGRKASERRYELETGISMDIDDYVEKPVNPEDFLHRVEKILSRK